MLKSRLNVSLQLQQASASTRLTRWAHLSIAWLLLEWCPHDSLHIANGLNMNGLLAIEYGLHVTLPAVGATLAYFVWIVGRQRAAQSA